MRGLTGRCESWCYLDKRERARWPAGVPYIPPSRSLIHKCRESPLPSFLSFLEWRTP